MIDIAACGVCRTDLQIVSGDLGMRRSPVILGHQVVGRVAGTGERVGLAWLAGACGRCRYCLGGRENLCELAEFTGWTVDGGYAERVVARSDFVYPLPDVLSDVQAAPLLCAGIIGYRSLRISGIRPGQRLGLFGFGSSAHLAIQVARHWGCEVAVFARSEAERELGLRLGAVVGRWLRRCAAGAARRGRHVRACRIGGGRRAGGHGAGRRRSRSTPSTWTSMPEFSYDLLWKERSLRSVANFTRGDAREFLELAAAIPIRAETTVFALDDAPEALAQLEAGAIRGSAVLDIAGS